MLATVLCRVIMLSCSNFREAFQNSREEASITQQRVFHSIEWYSGIRICQCLCCENKGCGDKRRKCSAKGLYLSSESIPQDVFCAKGNGVVLTRRIAKEEVSRRLYAKLKNILKTRWVWEKKFFLCYRRITGVTKSKACTRLLHEFRKHS